MINANNGDVICGKYRISVTITTEYDDLICQPLVRRLKESLKSEKKQIKLPHIYERSV